MKTCSSTRKGNNKMSNSSFIKHLKSKHPKLFSKLPRGKSKPSDSASSCCDTVNLEMENDESISDTDILEMKKDASISDTDILEMEKMQVHTCSCSGSSQVAQVQTTMEQILKKGDEWNNEGPKAKLATRLIGEMICLDLQPYSVVESKGFKRVIKFLCPKYKLPSRKHMTETIVPKIYDEIKDLVKTEVLNADYIFIFYL